MKVDIIYLAKYCQLEELNVTKDNMRLKYLSVMGTMGSGKTTVARLISKELKFKLIEENFGENQFLPRFYKQSKRWAFHSQTFFLMEKIGQMMETKRMLNSSTSEVKEKTTSDVRLTGFVQDTPIYQDVYSYAQGLYLRGDMDQAEWRLYQKIFQLFEAHLPKPDLIVYLETPLKILIDRIKGRARSFEQKIKPSYLKLLDKLNHHWLKQNKQVKVLIIETDGLNIITSQKAREELVERVSDRIHRL